MSKYVKNQSEFRMSQLYISTVLVTSHQVSKGVLTELLYVCPHLSYSMSWENNVLSVCLFFVFLFICMSVCLVSWNNFVKKKQKKTCINEEFTNDGPETFSWASLIRRDSRAKNLTRFKNSNWWFWRFSCNSRKQNQTDETKAMKWHSACHAVFSCSG